MVGSLQDVTSTNMSIDTQRLADLKQAPCYGRARAPLLWGRLTFCQSKESSNIADDECVQLNLSTPYMAGTQVLLAVMARPAGSSLAWLKQTMPMLMQHAIQQKLINFLLTKILSGTFLKHWLLLMALLLLCG
jgi:hypothetical protein